MGTVVRGTGSYVPSRRVDNSEIAGLVNSEADWIVERTGIRRRHYAAARESTSDLAAVASRAAMHRAGVGPESLDAVIVATSSPDQLQPSTACMLQPKIGVSGVPAFDVGAVCTGFVYALAVGDCLLRGGPDYRRMLVVGSEVYSRILNFADRTSSVFFGDGAGAVVLERGPEGYGILGHRLYAEGALADVVGVRAGGTREPSDMNARAQGRHLFHMDGRRVWGFATATLPTVMKDALGGVGADPRDVDVFILHQANARLVHACLDSLGVSREKAALTLPKYGNTAAASVPLTLDETCRQGRLKRGDLVVLAAVGGGMTAGAVVMRWY
jgi:3-oxoacyl-[acyl-carrier-protein] synthase-3